MPARPRRPRARASATPTRRFEPLGEHQRGGQQHAGRSTTPKPATSSRLASRRARTRRARRPGSQACATDACEPAKCARGVDDRVDETAPRSRPRRATSGSFAEADERLAERRLLDVEPVPARALGVDRLPPAGRPADAVHDEPRRDAAQLESARASAISFAQSPTGPDDDEVAAAVELDAGDPPRQLEIGLHALERRLVGRRDEDRVARRDIPARVSGGSGCPDRVTAFAARTADARRRAAAGAARATRSSARVAAAISSGPTPSPARHATVFMQAPVDLSVVASHFAPSSGARARAHFSCCEVGVCGV